MRWNWLCGLLSLGALACSSSDTTFPTSTTGQGGTATTGAGAGTGSGGETTSGTGGAGGQPATGGSGGGCQWSADGNPCGEGFYCNAPDCQSGTCEPVGVTDDGAKAPVCGCDGVNYWNASTAAAYGMPVASNGECAQALTCKATDANPCPLERHFCGQLVDNLAACVTDPTVASGVCWGMPKECPPIVIGGTYRPCNNQSLEPCVDECTAIKDERKHYPDSTCPQ